MLHGAMDEWTEPDALDGASHCDSQTLLLWYEAFRSVRLRRCARLDRQFRQSKLVACGHLYITFPALGTEIVMTCDRHCPTASQTPAFGGNRLQFEAGAFRDGALADRIEAKTQSI